MKRVLRLSGSKKLLVRTPDTAVHDILSRFVASAGTDSKRRVLRLMFVRHSYFRLWTKIPILATYWVSGVGSFESRAKEGISYDQQLLGLQIATAMERLLPFIQREIVAPFTAGMFKQAKERGVRVQEITQADVVNLIYEKFQGDFLTDSIASAMNELGPESQTLTAGWVRSLLGSVLVDILQKSRLCQDELRLDDAEVGKFYSDLVELGALKPLGGILWCLNPSCKNWEITITDRLRRFQDCPKCGEPSIFVTVLIMSAELSNLKIHDCDLSGFLAKLAQSYSQSMMKGQKPIPSLQAFPNVMVRRSSRSQEREVDLLLYSPVTRKCCAVECKVHEDSSKILPNTVDSVCTKDLHQLREILSGTGVGIGAYVTNLSLGDDSITKIRDRIIPNLGLRRDRTYLLPFNDEQIFLEKFGKLLRAIDPKARTPSFSDQS